MTQSLKQSKKTFQTAGKMQYADSVLIEEKTNKLIEKLKEHLKTIKKDPHLSFSNGETVYIPDIHGDIVHMITTLYRHGLLDSDLNLKKTHDYIFLGDFYDRGQNSDCVDFWVNKQIENEVKIYRLIGNHEMAFFERDPNGYPLIFPAQDSVIDINNNYQVTESLLKNIADGEILAAYVADDKLQDFPILYIHSFAINDDFIELGLEKNSDIYDFAHKLNERLKEHGKFAYDMFIEFKKTNRIDWKLMMKSFTDDPLFNMYSKKNDINTSFIWRRTGISALKIYPTNLDDIDIPNVYQIIGHTPVFSFKLSNLEINMPITLTNKEKMGKIQFSDVGFGYHFKEELDRPEVIINKKLALLIE
jgi:hypothetical protein